jgi:hypothetical protein
MRDFFGYVGNLNIRKVFETDNANPIRSYRAILPQNHEY